nr:2Fe-2S iron-sulfur cluster-binding protein [Paracraurococcus ruber]
MRIAGIGRPAGIGFTFRGQPLRAPAGEALAAALLAAGIRDLGGGHAAVCLIGTCQQCLVRVDGRLAQACLVPVRDGMVVEPA